MASWGPAGTVQAAIPGWKPSTSGAEPGRAAVARQGVSPMTTAHAGLTAIGRAGRLVDMVGGGSAAKRRPPVVSPAFPASSERPLRVLIVEDHPIFTELLLRCFHRHEWVEVVGCATNGRDGVVLASASQPDVVLMDIEMPIMDGIEATSRITERMPAVVFVLTASATPNHQTRALAAGARAVLPKTIDPALLIGHLQNVYLERAASGDALHHRARRVHALH
ncbi:MAG: response regulator transcription factor [Thermoleophilia bacterium]|nr:response regulator transcription factor [Thermoleophilia bacterium]